MTMLPRACMPKPIADRVDHTEERRRGATKPVWDRGETKDTCRDESGGLSGGRNCGDTTKTTMVRNFDFEPMIDKTAARQYRDAANDETKDRDDTRDLDLNAGDAVDAGDARETLGDKREMLEKENEGRNARVAKGLT